MLRITQPALDALRLHGEETYPHECCGVLIGRIDSDVRRVESAVGCGNTRTDSPQNRYNIAPRELVAAQRQARAAGMDIVGFYHSHPDHPPHWSETDLAEAHWYGCSYIITSVEKGRAAATRSFLLAGTDEEDKRFEDEMVEVVAGESKVPVAASETGERQ